MQDQDELIDDVEENVGQVVKMTKEAGEELLAAERYQTSGRKCKLVLFLIVLVGVLTVLVQLVRGR